MARKKKLTKLEQLTQNIKNEARRTFNDDGTLTKQAKSENSRQKEAKRKTEIANVKKEAQRELQRKMQAERDRENRLNWTIAGRQQGLETTEGAEQKRQRVYDMLSGKSKKKEHRTIENWAPARSPEEIRESYLKQHNNGYNPGDLIRQYPSTTGTAGRNSIEKAISSPENKFNNAATAFAKKYNASSIEPGEIREKLLKAAEEGRKKEEEQQKIAQFAAGELNYGGWTSGRTDEAREALRMSTAQEKIQGYEDQKESGYYNTGNDYGRMNAAGLDKWEKHWNEQMATAGQRAADLKSKTDQDIEQEGADLWTALVENDAVRNEQAIINGAGYTEQEKETARKTLQELTTDARITYYKIRDLWKTGQRKPAELSTVYDWVNGKGAYQKRTAGISEEEKNELDAQITKAYLAAITDPQEHSTLINNAESDYRYAQGQLEQIANTREWNSKYEQAMAGAPAEGDTAFHAENDNKKFVNMYAETMGNGINYANDPDFVYSFINGGSAYEEISTLLGDEVIPHTYKNIAMMLDDEIEVFNKYYNAGKKDEAMAFIDGLSGTLNQRASIFEDIRLKELSTRSPILATAATYGATVAQDVEFLRNAAVKGYDLITGRNSGLEDANGQWRAASRFKRKVRQDVGENMSETARFFYNAANSAIDSAINYMIAKNLPGAGMRVTEAETLGQFAMQAFESSMEQNLQETNGDYGRSAASAIIDALIETGTEIFSVEKILSEPTKKLMYILKAAGSEASEEFVGSVLGPYIHELFEHKNEWKQLADEIWNNKQYTDSNGNVIQVKTYNDAYKIAMQQWNHEILTSTLSGAISTGGGVFHMAGYALSEHVNTNRMGDSLLRRNESQQSGLDDLIRQGQEAAEGSKARTMADDLRTRIDKGETIKKNEAGKFAMEMLRENEAGRQKAEQSATEEKALEMIGPDAKNAKETAAAVAKALDEGEDSLTRQEKKLIRQNEQAQKIIEESRQEGENETKSAIREAQEEAGAEYEERGRQLRRTITRQGINISVQSNQTLAERAGEQVASEDEIRQAEGQRSGSKNDVLVEGKHAKVLRAENGKYIVEVDGKQETRTADEIRTLDLNTAAIIRQRESNPSVYSEAYTNKLLELNDQQDATTDTGRLMMDAESIRMAAFMRTQMPQTSLSEKAAWELREISEREATEEWKKSQEQLKGSFLGKNKGEAYFGGFKYGEKGFQDQLEGLSQEEKDAVNMAAMIAKRFGFRLDIKRASEMDNALVRGADTGKGIVLNVEGFHTYSEKTGTGTKQSLLVTLGHELTHFLRRNNVQGYFRVQEYVVQKLGAGTVAKRAQDLMDKYESKGKKISLTEAIEEVVANSCDQLLASQEAADYLKKNQPGLYKQIQDYVKGIVERIKAVLQQMRDSMSKESMQMAKYANELAKIWLGAYDEILEGRIQEEEQIQQMNEVDMQRNSFAETVEEYNDAVAKGDMEQADEKLRELAARRGYTEEAYHGTDSFGFTEFDMEHSQGEIFVAYGKDVAGTYTKNKKQRSISDAVKAKNATTESIARAITEHDAERRKAYSVNKNDMLDMLNETKETVMEWVADEWGEQDPEQYSQLMAKWTGMDASMFRAESPRALAEKLIDFIVNSDGNTARAGGALKILVDDFGTESFSEFEDAYYGFDWVEHLRSIAYKYKKGQDCVAVEDNNTGITSIYTKQEAIDKFRGIITGGIYTFLTRPGKQLVVDAKGAEWKEISVPWTDKKLTTRQIADYARENGYDSVRINDVYDNGGRSDSHEKGHGDIGIFFNQKDVKSADTVTYDEFGNPISPERRFTPNPDIRWSTADEDTRQEIASRANAHIRMNAQARQLIYDKYGIKENDIMFGIVFTDDGKVDYAAHDSAEKKLIRQISKADLQQLRELSQDDEKWKKARDTDEALDTEDYYENAEELDTEKGKHPLMRKVKPSERWAARILRFGNQVALDREAYADMDKRYEEAVARGDFETAERMLMDKYQQMEKDGLIGYKATGFYSGDHKTIAQAIKTGDAAVIHEAAEQMALKVPDNAVLIPMPPHEGKVTDTTDTLILAREISKITGRPVVIALESDPHMSRREAKQKGKTVTAESMGFRQAEKTVRVFPNGHTVEIDGIPDDMMPVFIDNAVAGGVTAKAAHDAMGRGITLAYAQTSRGKIQGAKYLSVTYDNNKKLIPLSQRMDPNNKSWKFSMAESVEVDEEHDLMAVHNLGEDQLLKVLKMGGFAMPSIAIIRGKEGHYRYGPISVIFRKQTIDPKRSTANRVYSGDAWTPTYPSIEYKVSSKVMNNVIKMLNETLPDGVRLDRVNLHPDNIQRSINSSRGNIVDAVRNNAALRLAYLMKQGKKIDLPMRDKSLDGFGRYKNDQVQFVADRIGEEEIRRAYEGGYEYLQEHPELVEKIRQALNDQFFEKHKALAESGKLKGLMRKGWYEEGAFGTGDAYTMLEALYKLVDQGVSQEIDEYKLKDMVDAEIDEEGYENWLKDTFKGVIEKSGIRNNRDYYTNSGNARSWEALHDEETLDRVVSIMRQQEERGEAAFFSQSAMLALGTRRLNSIDEIRRRKGQLQHISEEEMSEKKTKIVEGFGKIMDEYADPREDNIFIARDRVLQAMVDAVKGRRTVDGIIKSMKEWGYDITEETANTILSLMEEIEELPTEYFEAKPRRAVGLDEIAYVVLPADTDSELIDALEENGIEYRTYDGTEEDRTKQLNADESVRWSMAEEGMDVNAWMMSQTPSSVMTESERELISAYRGLRTKIDLTRKRIMDYTKRLQALEAKTDTTLEERDEMRELRNKIQVNQDKLTRLEGELYDVTSGEGYARIMYQSAQILRDHVEGKTAAEVQDSVEEMRRQAEKAEKTIAKHAAELKKMEEQETIKTAKRVLEKRGLSRATDALQKTYYTMMSRDEIRNRLAEIVLKQANGEDVTADIEELALDVVSNTRSRGAEDMESILSGVRGRTIVIGPGQKAELEANHMTIRDLQNMTRGSGVKFRYGSTSTLDTDVQELIDENPSLDGKLENEKGSIIDFANWLKKLLQDRIGPASEWGIDQGEVGAFITASVNLMLNEEMGGISVNDLQKRIQDGVAAIKTMQAAAEEMQQQASGMKQASIKAKGDAGKLVQDAASAIKYFNEMSKQAAEVERQRVRKGLIEVLSNEHTRDLIRQQEEYEERIKKDKKARELAMDNASLRSAITTVASRIKKRLIEETDEKNIPEEAKPLARMVSKMLTGHDMAGYRRVLNANKKQLADFATRLDMMDANSGAFDADTDLDWLVIRGETEADDDYSLHDKVVQDLIDIEQGLLEYRTAEGRGNVTLADRKAALKKVQNALSEIWSVIQARSQAEIAGRKYQVFELAESMQEDMANSPFKGERTGKIGRRIAAFSKFIKDGNMTPEYFFKNLKNKAMSLLHKGLQDAEQRSGLEAQKARERIARIAEETGYATWDGQEKHKVKLANGREIEMTTEQIMALYATWKRESTQMRPQDTAHLLKGGFVLAQAQDKGLYGREKAQQRPIRMTEGDLGSLADYLTPQQIEYVEKIVEYMSGELAELGNEASMRMYGIKKFTEKFYFPIKSWGGVLNKRSDVGTNSNNENRAARPGFSKRIRNNANNAIEISDFTPTAMKHIVGMITFNTVGPAVENMNKVLNQQMQYGGTTTSEETGETTDEGYKRNMRAAFQEAYGKGAYDYLTTFMKDVNGGVGRQAERTALDKLLSVFRKGAVAGSMSVALQQPLSYIRAAMLVNPKYLAAAIMPQHWGKIGEEMRKYSGLAVIKKMGRFDMNQGRSMQEYITPEGLQSRAKKTAAAAVDATTALPNLMDDVTWGRIWIACKMETQAQNPGLQGEELLQKTAEKFNEVIRRTQVYDSVMVKSQNMRSSSYAMKTITSFMAEPTLTLNVLADAVQNRHGKGGMKTLGMAGATYLLSAAMQALFKALMRSGRSPDKKKTWEEQFMATWFQLFIGEADPLTLIPGYSDAVELLKKGEVSDDALGVIGKIYSIVKAGVNMGTGKTDVYRGLEDTVGQLAQIFTNVPVKNLMRDARAMYNFFNPDTYAQRETSGAVIRESMKEKFWSADNMIGVMNTWLGMADKGYKTDNASYYERIYDAIKRGDKQAAEELKEYMLLTKITAEDPEKSLEAGVRKVIKADESLSTEESLELQKEYGLKQTGSYVLDQYKEGKIDRKQAEKLYRKENPNKTDKDVMEAFDKIDYEKAGGDAEHYSNYTPLYDAIEKNKAEEINKAVKKMMDAGYTQKQIKAQMTSKYKEAYLNADSNGKIKIRNAIQLVYKAIGLTAADADKIIDKWKND